MSDLIIIHTTVPDSTTADRIAADLIEQRLAACVQTSGAIQSYYTWEGKPHREREYALSIKTRTTLYDAVARRIETLHPYQVPEIIATDLTKCSPAYREWVLSQTQHTIERL